MFSTPARDRRLTQMHDAIGLGIRQRPQQHAVNDAENGGVRADAQSERQDESQRQNPAPCAGSGWRDESAFLFPSRPESSALLSIVNRKGSNCREYDLTAPESK